MAGFRQEDVELYYEMEEELGKYVLHMVCRPIWKHPSGAASAKWSNHPLLFEMHFDARYELQTIQNIQSDEA